MRESDSIRPRLRITVVPRYSRCRQRFVKDVAPAGLLQSGSGASQHLERIAKRDRLFSAGATRARSPPPHPATAGLGKARYRPGEGCEGGNVGKDFGAQPEGDDRPQGRGTEVGQKPADTGSEHRLAGKCQCIETEADRSVGCRCEVGAVPVSALRLGVHGRPNARFACQKWELCAPRAEECSVPFAA